VYHAVAEITTPLQVQSDERTPSNSIPLLSARSIVLFATIFQVHLAVKFRSIFVSHHVADTVGQFPVAAFATVISFTAEAVFVNFNNSLLLLSSMGWSAASTRAVLVDVPIVTLPFPLPLKTAFTFALSPSASNITEVQEAFVIFH
jgi:hypothetical protein